MPSILESIIMWREVLESGDIDYAISFQDTAGCHAIWDAIGYIQRQYMQHNEYGTTPTFAQQHQPYYDPNAGGSPGSGRPAANSTTKFPTTVSRETLPKMKEALAMITASDRVQICGILSDQVRYLTPFPPH